MIDRIRCFIKGHIWSRWYTFLGCQVFQPAKGEYRYCYRCHRTQRRDW